MFYPPTGERASLYGVSRGRVGQGRFLQACWVFGESFPSWLLALPGLGLECRRVFLRTKTHAAAVASLVGDSVEVSVAEDEPWKVVDAGDVGLLLCEGRPSRMLVAICERVGVGRIISTAPMRTQKRKEQCIVRWRTVHVDVEHSVVGGITDTRTNLYFSWQEGLVYPSSPLPTAFEVPKGVPRDASTVLGHASRHRAICRAPPERLLIPPRVEVIHSYRGQPVYHGGGLLPTRVNASTFVATRSVFFPSGDRWGIRHLTGKELLEAYDVPSIMVEALLASGFDSWACLDPVGSLVAGAALFLTVQYHGRDGGGYGAVPAPLQNGGGMKIVLPNVLASWASWGNDNPCWLLGIRTQRNP